MLQPRLPTVDRAKATVMTKVRYEALDARILPEMSAKVVFLSQAPGADDAARVADRCTGARKRPARIGPGVAREDQRQPEEGGDDQQPPGLANQTREAG